MNDINYYTQEKELPLNLFISLTMTAFLLFKIYIILIIIKYKKVALDMYVIPEKVTQ